MSMSILEWQAMDDYLLLYPEKTLQHWMVETDAERVDLVGETLANFFMKRSHLNHKGWEKPFTSLRPLDFLPYAIPVSQPAAQFRKLDGLGGSTACVLYLACTKQCNSHAVLPPSPSSFLN
jgi:hypothetical protein